MSEHDREVLGWIEAQIVSEKKRYIKNGRMIFYACMAFCAALAVICYISHERFTFGLLCGRVIEGVGDVFFDRGME